MANPSADFSLSSLGEAVNTDPQVIQKAERNLRRLQEAGRLPELAGWDGDSLEGYRDMLGLNGRPIRVNHGPGMRT